jgi:organic radical activating enzyme
VRTLSLPIFEALRPAAPAPADAADPAIDRSKPYPSCMWLEGGLAFNRRSLNACLITHHGRGFPHLCDYNGGPVDLDAVLAGRARVIRENQNGGHEACRGCPNLVTKDWRQPRHPVRLLAIAQFSHCNIECNYCYLQTQDPSVFSSGFDPYAVLPAIQQLSRQGVFDPHLIVDWGGGEPTIYQEFDDVLEFLTKQGATTWVHTNGTRLPKPIKNGLPTKRINILCSVDAGTRATWKLIKRKDLLETVWRNLAEFIRRGCRVQLKYIMKEENSSEAELRAFLKRALKIGANELVLDIDYDYPDPSPAVVNGIQTLRRRATAAGMHVTFGSTGAQYTPEIDAAAKVNDDRAPGRLHRAELWVKDRFAYFMTQVRIVVRILRYS